MSRTGHLAIDLDGKGEYTFFDIKDGFIFKDYNKLDDFNKLKDINFSKLRDISDLINQFQLLVGSEYLNGQTVFFIDNDITFELAANKHTSSYVTYDSAFCSLFECIKDLCTVIYAEKSGLVFEDVIVTADGLTLTYRVYVK